MTNAIWHDYAGTRARDGGGTCFHCPHKGRLFLGARNAARVKGSASEIQVFLRFAVSRTRSGCNFGEIKTDFDVLSRRCDGVRRGELCCVKSGNWFSVGRS